MKARDAMTGPVVSVHPETTLAEVARLMLEKGWSPPCPRPP